MWHQGRRLRQVQQIFDTTFGENIDSLGRTSSMSKSIGFCQASCQKTDLGRVRVAHDDIHDLETAQASTSYRYSQQII